MTTLTLWWTALVASSIVFVAVALLLGLIVATSRSVERHAAAITATGEQIARNTAPILALARATDIVREIRSAIDDLNRDTRSLQSTIAAMERDRL
jgi:hypothetical protein